MKPWPTFWSRADADADAPDGYPYALRVWGWSVSSMQEAAAVAAERLEQALAKVRSGTLGQSWGYYPRVPLREPVLAQVTSPDGALLCVVTRNRYGAEVLNTDRPLIADVDLPEQEETAAPSGRAGGLLGRLLGRSGPAQPVPPAQEGPSAAELGALERIAAFAATVPQWGVSVYRTAAGLRVIVTGGDLPPGAAASEEVLRALDSDPIYVTLCRTHQTYRARLTPKPWRCGHPALAVVWPLPRDADHQRWEDWVSRLHDGERSLRHVPAAVPHRATSHSGGPAGHRPARRGDPGHRVGDAAGLTHRAGTWYQQRRAMLLPA